MSLRVVLVEDNAVLALLAEEALAAANHSVVGSTGAEDEAVDLVLQHRPDLVLLDLRLSAGSGSRALKRIRERDDVPCLLVTSSTKEARELARNCLGILHKPFDLNSLVAAVDAVETLMKGEEIDEEVPVELELFAQRHA